MQERQCHDTVDGGAGFGATVGTPSEALFDETETDRSLCLFVHDATETGDCSLRLFVHDAKETGGVHICSVLRNDTGVRLRSERTSLEGTGTSVTAAAAAAAERDCRDSDAASLMEACSLTTESAEGVRSSCGLPRGTWIMRIRGVSAGGVIVPALMLGARDRERGVDGADSEGAVELVASVSSRSADGIVVVALGGGS